MTQQDREFEEKLQQIRLAQRNAAEFEVMKSLRQKGLMKDDDWELITGVDAKTADIAFNIN